MSKGQNVKQGSKKQPTRTMQEKKDAKRDKKNGKNTTGFIEQIAKK
jgi:hypothetical protein